MWLEAEVKWAPKCTIWSPWVIHRVTSPDPSFLILEIKPLNPEASDFTIHPTPALKDRHLCPRSNSLRRQTWDTSISESGLPPQVRGSFIYPKKGNLILSEVNKKQGHVYNQDAFSDNPRQRSSVSILHYSPITHSNGRTVTGEQHCEAETGLQLVQCLPDVHKPWVPPPVPVPCKVGVVPHTWNPSIGHRKIRRSRSSSAAWPAWATTQPVSKEKEKGPTPKKVP